MQKEEEPKGQNVKVVLRCRPMTSTEAAREKQSLRCTSDKTVEVQYPSLGKQAKKNFTFDGTFDETTSQKDMYDNVVRPVVDEVLQGYNCTVFAYGQTGTGKTYTMEGGIDKAKGDVIPPSAGVVPRAVAQVFKHLEENEVEYQVRISVVELYNEELSDLIASSDSEEGKLRKLRLLEDPKKGVVLQGVEERPVTCAADIFSILESTNRHRRTAETLCNKQSSRSHSIFTLKIFMKEKMVDEEEIIKTGLLNLVDLAGSECVGRSGAQGDRKKEAGQINQSLLTLGRVITSLVDRLVHVPYRESKLTRLLQESLGGRTKTTLIATVSPNSSNIEETLSTLDYASRAKAIKNTPQINQVQTKKAMMRELAGSIADLQEQLRAQREGNGVYLPTQKYEDMQAEMARLRDMETAIQQELDEKQKQFDELQAAFTETCETLEATRTTLKETEGTLQDTRVTLKTTETTLKQTETALEDTTAVLDEHKTVGDALYAEGGAVLAEAGTMREELGGLFCKIDRKAAVLSENERLAAQHQASLALQAAAAAEELQAFRVAQAARTQELQQMVAAFVVQKNAEVEGLKAQVEALRAGGAAAMDAQGEGIRGSTAEGIISLQAAGTLAGEQREAELSLVADSVAASTAAGAQVATALDTAKASVTEWAEKALSGIDADECIVAEFASKHKRDLVALKEKAEAAAAQQAAAAAADRAALEAFVAAREAAFAEMRAGVEAEVGRVLQRALAEQQAQIAAAVGGVMSSLASHKGAIESAAAELSAAVEASAENTTELKVMVVGRATRAKKDTEERANRVQGAVAAGAAAAAGELAALKEQEAALRAAANGHRGALAKAVSAAVEEQEQLCAAAEDKREGAAAAQEEAAGAVLAALDAAAASAASSAGAAGAALAAQDEAVETHCAAAFAALEGVRGTQLQLRADAPTGATPLKREIALPGALPAFRADREVIRDLRGIAATPPRAAMDPVAEGAEGAAPEVPTLALDAGAPVDAADAAEGGDASPAPSAEEPAPADAGAPALEREASSESAKAAAPATAPASRPASARGERPASARGGKPSMSKIPAPRASGRNKENRPNLA